MMKRRKWLISLVVLGVIMGFSVPKPKAGINGDVSLDSLAVRDTVALPPLSYSMKVGKDTLILPDSSKAWNNFFNELDSLRAGKDTAITIVQLGDSHIQAGHLSGRVMRLFQQAFGNAGRGWIAPFKLSKTNEPDDYFIKSVAKDWIAGRCIQHVRKTPIGIGGIGIKSVSPSINLDVVITPNNGAGYEFNEAILYRGEKSMPMLPAGALKDSVQTFRADTVCVPDVLADTFRISCLTDTLQLQSTRRKEEYIATGLILYEFILWPDTEEWRQGYLIPFHRSEWGDVCELYGRGLYTSVGFIKTVLTNHLYGNQRDIRQTF